MRKNKFQLAFLCILSLIFVMGCDSTGSYNLSDKRWPVKIEVLDQLSNDLSIKVKNLSPGLITTRVSQNGELAYSGSYAYNDEFCKEKLFVLSNIIDFFNSKLDTIEPGKSKVYSASLYNKFTAEVLDSTMIYSFEFALNDSFKKEYKHYIVCARGEDGIHRVESAGRELLNHGNQTIEIEVSNQLCTPDLITVESGL